MRLSFDQQLANFVSRVLLDGKEIKFVREADEENGVVEFHPVGEDGRLILDGMGFRVERAYGSVSIQLRMAEEARKRGLIP